MRKLILLFCMIVAMAQARQKDTTIYNIDQLEHPAEFPGGVDAFFAFIGKNIRWPSAMSDTDVYGKVYVSFVIEKDGSVSNVKAINKLNPLLDTEATRVIKLSPKWLPGKRKGHAVRMRYTFPVSFEPNSD